MSDWQTKFLLCNLRRAWCCVVYQVVTGLKCLENHSVLTGQLQGTRKHT